MNILEIENLTKSFKNKNILNDINLHCKTGEAIGVFGRNGSGKSTLLKLIYGVLKADAINIKINNKQYQPANIIPSQTIAYLPQDTFLPKNITVREVIPFFFKEGGSQEAIFYAPNVSSFEKIKIGKLSVGQLRYLELLIIGNLKHPFLLLDEPFAMVEPIYKEVIKKLLLKLKKHKGIILTDHYYNDVLEVATDSFMIKDSKKIVITNKKDLIKYGYLGSK